MGRLEVDGRTVLLAPTTTLGRASGSDVRLADDSISRAHALLLWGGAAWTVRDLASQNGTFVAGRRLEPGREAVVREGDALGFGDVDARLVCAAPPRPQAITDGEVREAEGSILWFEEPELAAVAYADGRWVFEKASGARVVHDGDTIEVGPTRYRLRLPGSLAPTHPSEPALSLMDVELSVEVSANLEHIAVTAVTPRGTHDLGARAHHQLLWLLARARQTDLSNNVSSSEAGWVDMAALPRMAGASENLLYTHIHRLRRQLESIGLADAGGVVERRLQAGQLRLGPCHVSLR